MKSNQKHIIIQSDGGNSAPSKLNPTLVAIFSLLGIGGFWWWQKGKAATSAEEEAAKIANNIFAKQASEFKKLIGEWYQFANNAAIILLAKQITDWPKVVASYSLLYSGSNLLEDLRKALNDLDYKAFLFALNQKGVPAVDPKGNTVVPSNVPVGLVAGKSYLKPNTASGNISLYKSLTTYTSGKNDLMFAKNAAIAPVLFIKAVDFKYNNTGVPFVAKMYLIQLSNKAQYYMRAADFVKVSTAIKGLNSITKA